MQDRRHEHAGTGSEPMSTIDATRQSEASQTLRSAKEKAGAAYGRTADQATRAYHGARGYAQNNPGVAAATTFAAGLGLGLVIGGRRAARAYRRGLIPVVALALARAVRDVFERLH